MYSDFVEFKPPPRRHHRTSVFVAAAAGLAVAFGGGWALAPHDTDEAPRPVRRWPHPWPLRSSPPGTGAHRDPHHRPAWPTGSSR